MVSTGFFPILPNKIGAIEPYVYGLAKELSKENVVDVFGLGNGSEKIGNMRVRTFAYQPNVKTFLESVFGYHGRGILYNAYLLRDILHFHQEQPIDIIHINTLHSSLATTICKLILKIPFVVSVHNKIRTSLPLKESDIILANSEYIRKFLIEERKMKADKVQVLPIAIDTAWFKPEKDTEKVKEKLGLSGSKVILFVGRKCPEKGPLSLIEALPTIIHYDPKVLAIFIGPDYFFDANSTAYTGMLLIRAKELKVEDHVIFKSFIPAYDLMQYYNAADIFVCPSIWEEPSGMVILEALACEKPVIASNVGGIPEIISQGINGILVCPGKPKEIANAVTYLLKNPEFAKYLGKNGRRIVVEKFSFEVVSNLCLRIYEKVLNLRN